MNINLTLIGQSISFALFVWFCMRYVWPPLIGALHERQERITEGLSMAERGKREMAEAQDKAKESLEGARLQGVELIAQANIQAKRIVEEAKQQAVEEARRQKELAVAEIEREQNRARERLRSHLGSLVIQGAEKVLQKSIDADTHSEVLTRLSKEL